jgi:hypothetical protein
MIPRAMLAVAYSTGRASHAISRVMTQTKRDTLVLRVRGFGVGLTTPHSKKQKSNKGKSWMDVAMMERVGDRKKWKDLVRQAKAHSRL